MRDDAAARKWISDTSSTEHARVEKWARTLLVYNVIFLNPRRRKTFSLFSLYICHDWTRTIHKCKTAIVSIICYDYLFINLNKPLKLREIKCNWVNVDVFPLFEDLYVLSFLIGLQKAR